ncbi:hypothetical protein AVME950_00535 [Acidovorax sp. SUPP950]|uniref:S1C family serine protease n=1 Tax=Acidovorax sp. SUPP950 TaxID=511901 RepID=UPI0023CDF3C6|nr:S1C family serine protease [Acidovorax sp. SUPP950]GKS73325.1 hypothetical protein AVME950_00535 [Acidovorax sp. SUPP950]
MTLKLTEVSFTAVVIRKLGLPLIFLGVAFNSAAQEPSAEALVSRIQGAIVSIQVTSTPEAAQASKVQSSEELVPARIVATDGRTVGSGTLVSADGLILTIASLFDPSGEILVTTEGGREYIGKVVAQDRRTGFALVKINAQGMAYLEASNARRLAPAERALGLGRTTLGGFSSLVVSDGLVTRAYDELMDTPPFIQTSVPVLPGTGGGPLIRQKTGEFVGVISQQYVPRVGTPITFATPTNVYLSIAEELLEKGRVDRAVIHTQVSLLNSEQARLAGVPAGTGVVIHATRSDGPADRAGLLVGDIVLAVDGTPATSINAYVQAISSKKPGVPIDLKVFRRGAMLDIRVVGDFAP